MKVTKNGGVNEDRTRDLFVANETLYQLSYNPTEDTNNPPKADVSIIQILPSDAREFLDDDENILFAKGKYDF